MKKRLTCLLLVLAMVLAMVPAAWQRKRASFWPAA